MSKINFNILKWTKILSEDKTTKIFVASFGKKQYKKCVTNCDEIILSKPLPENESDSWKIERHMKKVIKQ